MENKMTGWVARDNRENFSRLHFFTMHPHRENDKWCKPYYSYTEVLRLNKDMFPELKWEDEPIHVEMVISAID